MDELRLSKALETLTEASEAAASRELLAWRAAGGKVVGYYCTYVPEEIITAAGAVAIRLRARTNPETDTASAYMGNMCCSYVKHTFDMAMKGKYDFLDGVVVPTCCDSIRHMHENWVQYIPSQFSHQIEVPRRNDQDAHVAMFRDQLVRFREHLESALGVEITDERLHDAIKLHNETRALQRRLYELRKRENPPISGALTLTLIVAGTSMPKTDYNPLLRTVVEELEQVQGVPGARARLMFVGSCLDDPAYLDVIEGQGGIVVCDSQCFGSFQLSADVSEEGDPLDAITKNRLVDQAQCPHVSPSNQRTDYVKKIIEDFKVDGIVCSRMAMCDNWAGENFLLNRVEKLPVPVLNVEREYFSAASGQLSTRVQAFLETIEGARV